MQIRRNRLVELKNKLINGDDLNNKDIEHLIEIVSRQINERDYDHASYIVMKKKTFHSIVKGKDNNG